MDYTQVAVMDTDSKEPGRLVRTHLPAVWGRVWVVAALFSWGIQVCSACKLWEFRCLNGECVQGVHYCDTVPHCTDLSDEIHCPGTEQSSHWPLATCSDGYFQCDNRRCVYSGWRCDGQDDCGDASDEKDCLTMERLPIMSMGSIVGLSIVVAGVFVLFIGIAVLLTCIRRKNITNAREVARQRYLLSQVQDCHPYSASGLVFGRQPPPMYTSQADLTMLSASILQEHLANLSMQPPPTYSSQPDLSQAVYSPRILEAPPSYTSQIDLRHHQQCPQAEPDNLEMTTDRVFEMPDPEVPRVAFDVGSGITSMDRLSRELGTWPKDSAYESSPASDSSLSEAKKSKNRAKIIKEVKQKERSPTPGSPPEGGFRETHSHPTRRLIRGIQGPCKSTPSIAIVGGSANRPIGPSEVTEQTSIHRPLYKANRKAAMNSGGTFRHVGVPYNCNNSTTYSAGQESPERHPRDHSYSLMDIPSANSEVVSRSSRTRPVLHDPLPAVHTTPPDSSRDTFHADQSLGPGRGISLQLQKELPTLSPNTLFHTTPAHPAMTQKDRDSDEGVPGKFATPVGPSQQGFPPVLTTKPGARNLAHGLDMRGESESSSSSSPPVLDLNVNRLQAQRGLSKSLSMLSGHVVQRSDSLSSIASWDC